MTATDIAPVPVALTIAGSDSGGGAGIQADLKTFAFHCVHGTSAITCITSQNTLGVTRVDALPAAAVVAQIEAVVKDIGAYATKTGMLLNKEIIVAVAEQVENLKLANLVVDPVMVSRTGAQLIDNDAIITLREVLLPKAAIATPNRYEAQLLSGLEIHTLDDMRAAAARICSLGAAATLVKGGSMSGNLKGVDVWFDGNNWETLKTTKVETNNTHGSGCTLSAAIAANLARGVAPLLAVKQAKEYVTGTLKHALSIGQGTGPVGHFFPFNNSITATCSMATAIS
ncbi:MAG: bifunctional hydroxymethylpyrimidine kinase/phosphomethylpyrimidine kinase [Oscillatoriaceae bacterium SKW80]|nr:bifunctional hydroxymethylpyrimidine kinase/phosphomethylpyrimidine kinase [Oscillatoriaceae bacterium SKYG93]MCX8119605.1 bifunctional hydroxymethylpyrimidine kinase/phosphomethylpyrimidine kinase [Oscillatoriaceae bacterium SKW80]MDW8455072.1 bifunctional hydroxymethylpyrimidine kinase/phosphomethylpyrimidine kinase [Oscillatoriaceae cyanobacterium SKYGB_i_bin93]HIK28151.1 bifunctional hydroxymethylpyrimidine kinase/phosphomethylpyrimidine kinase [Oscillatoriaceae cyanobacterium M7585_C2015